MGRLHMSARRAIRLVAVPAARAALTTRWGLLAAARNRRVNHLRYRRRLGHRRMSCSSVGRRCADRRQERSLFASLSFLATTLLVFFIA